MDLAPYRWKIDRDYLDGDNPEQSAVGKEGPSNLDPTISDNPQGFTLYDDDRFDEACGRYGCPNCLGEGLEGETDDDSSESDRGTDTAGNFAPR